MNRNLITGTTPRVEMYDINVSAIFITKPITESLWNVTKDAGVTRVYVDKVKFKHLVSVGMASFIYDPVNGRYLPCEESHDPSSLWTNVSPTRCAAVPAGYLKKNLGH